MAEKFIIVSVIIVPIGFVFWDFASYGMRAAVMSFFGSSEYVGSWWYITFYIYICLIFPFMDIAYKRLCQMTVEWKLSKPISMVAAGALVGYFMTFIDPANRIYAMIFVEGYACSEWKAFETAERLIKGKAPKLLLAVSLLAAVIAIRVSVSSYVSYHNIDVVIIIPFVYAFVIICSYLGRMIRWLAWLGRYSTYMWLIHSFYIDNIFRKHITVSGIDIVIFVQLLLMSLATAYFLAQIEKLFCRSVPAVSERLRLKC